MVEQALLWRVLCIMRVLPYKAHTNLAIANSRPDWAVSSVVEHCLHTAGVTSSKLVPPPKNLNNINDLQLPTDAKRHTVS